MLERNFPEHWEVVKLGDVCNIVMGQSPPSATYNNEGVGMPFLQGKTEFTELFPVPTKYCTKRIKVSPKGSVLMSVRAPVGDVNLADRRYIIGRGLTSIDLKCGNNRFLFYLLLHNKKEFEAKGSGSTFKSINKSTINDFGVSLPPPAEQGVIAHVLQTIQEAKFARQREIALERERKAVLMDHLFAHGTKGESRKQTEIGKIPDSWEVVKLGDLCTFTTGKLNSEKAIEDGQYPFFTCSQETFRIDSYAFDQEAILLSGNNARGIFSVKYYKGKFDAYQRTYVITVKNTGRLSYRYFLYDLFLKLELLRRQSIGATTKYLTAAIIRNLVLTIPPLSEQLMISSVLWSCDKKIATLEQEAAHIDELFHTMLDELMTGQRSAVHLLESGVIQ